MKMSLSLSLSSSLGASVPPYTDYATYLDFKNQVYAENGTPKASLASVTGYSFTDSVDNVPNITAAGFESLRAQTSALTISSPIVSDVDFVIYATASLTATNDGVMPNNFIRMTGGDVVDLVRQGSDNIAVVNSGDAQYNQGTFTTGLLTILYRRRAGKDTMATNKSGTVLVGTESGATTLGMNGTAVLNIGHASSTYQLQDKMEFVGIRLGTFSDADLTDILTAAQA